MKRNEFLKSIAGLVGVFKGLTSNNKPYEVLHPVFTHRIPSNDTLSNIIDDIISKTGGKINGHTIQRVYLPKFLVNTERGEVGRDILTYRTGIKINDTFFDNKWDYSEDVKNQFNLLLDRDMKSRDIVRDMLIQELEGRVDNPTYLYGILISPPIVNPYTFNQEYSFYLRMC
jgi:hypothetical protein